MLKICACSGDGMNAKMTHTSLETDERGRVGEEANKNKVLLEGKRQWRYNVGHHCPEKEKSPTMPHQVMSQHNKACNTQHPPVHLTRPLSHHHVTTLSNHICSSPGLLLSASFHMAYTFFLFRSSMRKRPCCHRELPVRKCLLPHTALYNTHKAAAHVHTYSYTHRMLAG